jgi:hypothetical protein
MYLLVIGEGVAVGEGWHSFPIKGEFGAKTMLGSVVKLLCT